MSVELMRSYLDILNEQQQQLDEGVMDTLKGLVGKVTQTLGPETSKEIAQKVQQATGGDLTLSKENAIRVAKALGFDKMSDQTSQQMAEAGEPIIAGNWQGKIKQLLYGAGMVGSLASGSGFLVIIGVLMIMFAGAVFGGHRGTVSVMGHYGNKGTETDKGPRAVWF